MINGARVRQARELQRWTQARLLQEVPDLTQSRLSRIESGAADLTANSLAAASIAMHTGVTVEWLERAVSPALTGLSPHFRARSRTSQGTKATGLAWAELVNEAHTSLSPATGTIQVTLRRMPGQDAREAARQIRQDLGFPALTPLPYLVLALERVGVRVLALPWRCDSVDAFCAWADDRPTVAVAADVPGDRRRWTVAHELGHLVLHDPTQQGKDIEAEADAFAAELLTPLDALRLHMPSRPTLQTLTMIKTQWGVSVKSLVRRARELGVVDEDRATSLYRQISSRGWNKAEPGYVAVEKPRGLRLMVEVALPGEPVTALARHLGWSVALAQAVLTEHARADELPPAYAASGSVGNVVSLADRRRQA